MVARGFILQKTHRETRFFHRRLANGNPNPEDSIVTDCTQTASPAGGHVAFPAIARPTPDQPGTLAEQLAAVDLSLYLGARRGTTAADEWADARRLVMPHARPDAREVRP